MTEIQYLWRVTWFPPNQPDKVKTGGEAYVRRIAREQAEWFPIIERRELVPENWETVK